MTSKEKLLTLAAFLKTVPPERWDYSNWVNSDWQGKLDLSCGTKACALGWAATIPAFAAAGLTLRIVSRANRHGYLGTVDFTIDSHTYNGTDAAAKFFGIPYWAADRIFSRPAWLDAWNRDDPSNNVTAVEVAEYIEQYVADRSSLE